LPLPVAPYVRDRRAEAEQAVGRSEELPLSERAGVPLLHSGFHFPRAIGRQRDRALPPLTSMPGLQRAIPYSAPREGPRAPMPVSRAWGSSWPRGAKLHPAPPGLRRFPSRCFCIAQENSGEGEGPAGLVLRLRGGAIPAAATGATGPSPGPGLSDGRGCSLLPNYTKNVVYKEIANAEHNAYPVFRPGFTLRSAILHSNSSGGPAPRILARIVGLIRPGLLLVEAALKARGDGQLR